MKQRVVLIFVALASLAILSIAPVSAKGMPSFFTIEGPGISTPIPFTADIDMSLGPDAVFDTSTQINADADSLGEYYVIHGYVMVEADEGETLAFESLLTPLHYYPQEDGQGIIRHIGPINVSSEYTNHFYAVSEQLEAQIQDTITMAHWFQLVMQAE